MTELDKYKKALDMACEEIPDCPPTDKIECLLENNKGYCYDCWARYFLKKAAKIKRGGSK